MSERAEVDILATELADERTAHQETLAERDSLAAALTEAKQQAWEFADAMEKQKQFALDQINARDAALTETQQALERADDLLRRLAEWDMLFPGNEYTPTATADAPYWQNEIAQTRAALADVSGSEGESPVSG